MSGETIAWLLWIAMFWVIEGEALFRQDYEGTLTAHLRKWFAMSGKPKGWRARRIVLVGFLGWLCLHLLAPPGSF